MLDDNVAHVLPEGITLGVQSMNGAEGNIIRDQTPVLAAKDNGIALRVNGNGPDPGLLFLTQGAQSNSFLGEHLHLFITTGCH